MAKQLDVLSDLVHEIDAKAHVNELFSAQLLLRVGLLYQDPHHFVAEVIENVGRDLAVAGSRVENAFGAQRARDALEYLETFQRSIQPVLDSLERPSVN